MDDNEALATFYDIQVNFLPSHKRQIDDEVSILEGAASKQAFPPEANKAQTSGTEPSHEKAAKVNTEVGGFDQGGARKKPRTECESVQLADASSPKSVPASKLLLSLYSGVLRPFLAACKDQATLEVPCESVEHAEAGRLVVEMILDLPRPTNLKQHNDLWHTLPLSQLIRCIHFAVFWDAQPCVELCIDSLAKMDQSQLSIKDVEALLDLPGVVQVIESQRRKVEEVCKKGLMQEFGNASQVLADDALIHRLCSLSPYALELLCQCDLGARKHTLSYLALWFSRARSVCGADEKSLFSLMSTADAGKLLSLPPAYKGIDLCKSWLLHYFNVVYIVIRDEELQSCFCDLSFPAVRLWATLDELQVYNKNDVAVLLSLWCKSNEVSIDTQHSQYAELSDLVRVMCLSIPFRHVVLPELP
ncbi:hypothetical protein DUNSADRAFT_10579 [Dunaliella salina]|uniref:BACK domain-containing protein n=1 Tax=Dunaliella salina TaxID=3046 RepID=A0ABQ7H4Z6_DUNSA|nr:hypothetical protein DUNSADRAFT_10579 [Dunaliella salina]|eukprot:KAF5841873.1 hypothetical protein DUNSADRAFT_10579 [Dunaliella salina]